MEAGQLGEFSLIERLVGRLGTGEGVVLGAGDDAAALRPTPGMLLLATCDSQVEGRHFLRSRITAEQLGRRFAAVNISDIAAMGGEPRWALVSLALPPSTELGFLEALYAGLDTELGRFGAAVVGGNITAAETLMLDLTLLGEVEPERMLRRSGARPGDAILVTGDLGASAAGRAALDAGIHGAIAEAAIARHLTPEPQVAAARALGAAGLLSAAIDVSDGFAQDLGHICDASGAGAEIDASALPITDTTHGIAEALGLDAVQLALTGGEDYELICTAAPVGVPALIEAARTADVSLRRVGTVLHAAEGRYVRYAGRTREPLAGGWQHFRAGGAP